MSLLTHFSFLLLLLLIPTGLSILPIPLLSQRTISSRSVRKRSPKGATPDARGRTLSRIFTHLHVPQYERHLHYIVQSKGILRVLFLRYCRAVNRMNGRHLHGTSKLGTG